MERDCLLKSFKQISFEIFEQMQWGVFRAPPQSPRPSHPPALPFSKDGVPCDLEANGFLLRVRPIYQVELCLRRPFGRLAVLLWAEIVHRSWSVYFQSPVDPG